MKMRQYVPLSLQLHASTDADLIGLHAKIQRGKLSAWIKEAMREKAMREGLIAPVKRDTRTGQRGA